MSSSAAGALHDLSDVPLVAALLTRSCSAARRAALEVRKIVLNRKLDIVEKESSKDLQTAADRNSQQAIVATLKYHFPTLRVIGEESDLPALSDQEQGELVSNDVELSVLDRAKKLQNKLVNFEFANAPIDEYTVWVDPLDGTNEFTEGALAEPYSPARALLEHVTILIGIAHRDEPVAGVIYQPFHAEGAQNSSDSASSEGKGRLIWVLRHCGVFGIDAQLAKNLAERPDVHKQVIMVNTRSHDSALVRETIAAVKPDEVLRVGGCGYKLLLICERRANCYAYPSLGTKKWDTCAPQCLVDELGGKFTDMLGQRLRYGLGVEAMNRQGLLACASQEVYDKVNALIPESAREAMRHPPQSTTNRH